MIIKLKTQSQTVNIVPFPGLAQSGTEQPGQGATLLGWPKIIYYILSPKLTCFEMPQFTNVNSLTDREIFQNT